MHFSVIFHIDTTLPKKDFVEDTLISAISEGGMGAGPLHGSQKDQRCVWPRLAHSGHAGNTWETNK